jgi:hypothetical protein
MTSTMHVHLADEGYALVAGLSHRRLIILQLLDTSVHH